MENTAGATSTPSTSEAPLDFGTTLVRQPSDEENRRNRVLSPADQEARSVMNYALWALLSGLLLPALSPILSYRAIRRAFPLLDETGHGLRTAVALCLGVAAGLCGLCFYLLWGLLRPAPVGLLTGWVGLRHLPAIPIGFQHTPEDPFGFSPDSFQWPAKKGK